MDWETAAEAGEAESSVERASTLTAPHEMTVSQCPP